MLGVRVPSASPLPPSRISLARAADRRHNPRMAGFCTHCGKPLLERARFCGVCGHGVPGGPRSGASASAPSSTKSSSNSPAPAPARGIPAGLPARYEVSRFLGKGAVGRVYLCRDTELDVDVAVKILLPEVAANGNAVRKIRKEARAAARLRKCPGILSLYGFEHSGDSWYLVMEFAPGGTLQDRMQKRGRLSEGECRRIGAEVAGALAFAHAHEVIHRDIKPANILFSGDGRGMVGDFGLARVFDDGGTGPRTVTLAGTPVYMAPEIMLKEKVDGRADLFSLGCTLFEAATGERAFPGDFTEMAVAKADRRAPAPDPREARPDLSEDFSGILRRLLSADPRKRFPDGDACARALSLGADETSTKDRGGGSASSR